MTNKEVDLMCRILRLRIEYENAYPEVGIPPGVEWLLDDELNDAALSATDDEKRRILESVGHVRY